MILESAEEIGHCVHEALRPPHGPQVGGFCCRCWPWHVSHGDPHSGYVPADGPCAPVATSRIDCPCDSCGFDRLMAAIKGKQV